MKATDSSRLTECPAASFSTKVSSRVFFTFCAISLIAWSQLISSHSVPPGRRTSGFSRRRSFMISCCSEDPLGHSVPRLVGWSGSPSTCTTCGVTFFALSPRVWIMTPHATEQYGHSERVSVVREIFNSCDAAYALPTSNPSRDAAAPPALSWKNRLLVDAMLAPLRTAWQSQYQGDCASYFNCFTCMKSHALDHPSSHCRESVGCPKFSTLDRLSTLYGRIAANHKFVNV